MLDTAPADDPGHKPRLGQLRRFGEIKFGNILFISSLLFTMVHCQHRHAMLYNNLLLAYTNSIYKTIPYVPPQTFVYGDPSTYTRIYYHLQRFVDHRLRCLGFEIQDYYLNRFASGYQNWTIFPSDQAIFERNIAANIEGNGWPPQVLWDAIGAEGEDPRTIFHYGMNAGFDLWESFTSAEEED